MTKILLSAIVLGGLASLFVLHPFTPNFPSAGLDASWAAVTGEAADHATRWGVDTIFIYGPASPLATNYPNAAYFTLTLPLLIGFAALFGWCAALLVARGPRPAVATALCGLAIVSANERTDALFLALPFLVFLLAVSRDAGWATRGATLTGAFAMGLTALVKVSFPLVALPLFVLADGASLARRRWPTLLPMFGLGIVAGALLYGQRLSDLPAYAAAGRETVMGYAGAMAVAGSKSDLALFVVIASGLVALVAFAGRRRSTGMLVPIGLAIELLLLFKAGFVRHDLHALTAWTGLVIVGTVLAWSRLSGRATLAVTAVACGLAFVYQPYLRVRQNPPGEWMAALERRYETWLVRAPTLELGNLARALSDPAGYRDAVRSAKADIRQDIARAAPIAPLDGAVDVLPSQQSRIIAAGLDYRGRPSFQEYSTYTATLEAANLAFLEGPRAPRWILFGPESGFGWMTLDTRFPNFAEGALWLDLLRLYRPDHRVGALVALKRRDAPAAVVLGPPQAATIGFGTFAPVSESGPVWAQIRLKLNRLGRLASVVFWAPPVTLAVRVGGVERRYRMVPDLAETGFLLSPIVNNASDFERLASGRPIGADRRVAGIAIEGSAGARMFYDPGIVLTTRPVDMSGLAASDGSAGGATPADATAWDALVRTYAAAGGADAAENGTLQAPAGPNGILNLPLSGLPVQDGRRKVALGYGLTEDAPAGTRVCFQIHPADGTLDTPWVRCLEPSDHVRHDVTLEMPESVTELALETSSLDDVTAYWSKPSGSDRAR